MGSDSKQIAARVQLAKKTVESAEVPAENTVYETTENVKEEKEGDSSVQ